MRCLSLLCSAAGLVFAGPMRKREYVTVFDPLQRRYHGVVVVLLYTASIVGDVFWSASILTALGACLPVWARSIAMMGGGGCPSALKRSL